MVTCHAQEYFICVQDCDEESGSTCGGYAANHEYKYLRNTMKDCCEDNMGWEPVVKCIEASKKHSHTTRRLVEVEDSQGDKRVFTGMHEILKAKIGKLEDTINTNGKALGDANKALGDAIEGRLVLVEDTISTNGDAIEGRLVLVESKMEELEGDMKEMKGDMKEIKGLLMQLVGSNNVETKTNE